MTQSSYRLPFYCIESLFGISCMVRCTLCKGTQFTERKSCFTIHVINMILNIYKVKIMNKNSGKVKNSYTCN